MANGSGGDLTSGLGEDDPFVDLWQACAGRLFYVPKVGEVVYYFPQGHVEQVKRYANKEDHIQLPSYNLRSKIRCRVVNSELKVDTQTDEVYAQFTLLPLAQEKEATAGDDDRNLSAKLQLRAQVCFFSKTLTASDILPHGGFTIPKLHADECFPPLNPSEDTQKLIMKDLHGQEWSFCQKYRGRPKRHKLTKGWSKFVSAKKLVEGDTVIYLRGDNGELRIGIRRSMRSPRSSSASVISGHSMLHGILANAAHAVSTGSLFTVFCHPWTCPSCFIIPTARYMKSEEESISIGTRFSMLFENEECVEQRFTATVVGIDDLDPLRWPCSKWRCLQVKWDGPVKHPQQISPWNIERTPSKKTKRDKEPKKRCILGKTYAVKHERHSCVLQGQENKDVESSTRSRHNCLKLSRIVDTSSELHSPQSIIN